MTEAEQTSLPEPVADPDATLVTPRFGEAEAQTARPVVPLASAARRRRRVWPLLVISALLGGAVSIFGLYVYQRERTRGVVAQPAAEQRQQTAVAAPNSPPDAKAQAAQVATQSSGALGPAHDATAHDREQPQAGGASSVAEAKKEQRAVVAAKREADKKEAKDKEKPARAAGTETRPRLVEVIRGGDGAP